MGNDPPLLFFDEYFWAGAHNVEVRAVQVKQVRRRIDSPEVPVDVEGMERCRAGDSLGRDGLDDVSFDDVFAKGGDVGLVTRLTDVGLVLLVKFDGALGWKGDVLALECTDQRRERFLSDLILALERSCRSVRIGDMEICYDHHLLKEMVHSNNSIAKHKQTLRYLHNIFQLPPCFGLEILDAVVAHVTERTASDRW